MTKRRERLPLDSTTAKSFSWLFESKEIDGQQVFNLERLAAGDFNWTDHSKKHLGSMDSSFEATFLARSSKNWTSRQTRCIGLYREHGFAVHRS